MQTSVIGFPRIGSFRELKFECEKYFKGDIEEKQLMEAASGLRERHWLIQRDAEISFIPSNDFSFYDMVLDTAVMLGIVPKRYRELELSELDTYFAMARGYQKDGKDVCALAMKKWFNTNYHYIVPELEVDTCISLSDKKLMSEYEQARSIGIETKPVVIGPYTMLKLCKYTGNATEKDYSDDVAVAYRQLIKNCSEKGIEWLQIDEPALVYDMSEADKELFDSIYKVIFPEKKNSIGTRILVQTYFGDVRDVYDRLSELPIDGIGLDFIEGRKTQELLKKYGFPQEKLLFAGVVNGKNIWKNNYENTLKIINNLKVAGINTVISTSCSLLHVPYTTANESRLSKECLAYFSFAQEKLTELFEISELTEVEVYSQSKMYLANQKLFETARTEKNSETEVKISRITQTLCDRKPSRSQRQSIQAECFKLPPLPTTTIGSFPQTSDVKANRSAYKKGEISREQYEQFCKDKIAECIKWQENNDIDVLVHGEYERNDMVEYFGEALGGFLFTEKGWVQSYGTRCVKPPVIWSDIYRKKPITVEWSVYAQSLTDKIVKGMLTGPVTILNWSFPREDISIKEATLQIALAIREEVLDLEKNGIRIIQIDEAAFREKLPLRKAEWYSEYLDTAIMAFKLTNSGVKPKTQIHTHMCYSDFTDIIPAIDAMDADVITFEASRSSLQILDYLRENNFETEAGPGVYDIHSPRVPSVEEIIQTIEAMIEKIGAKKLWINPDCGLKTRGIPETKLSLKNMVEAARIVREQL